MILHCDFAASSGGSGSSPRIMASVTASRPRCPWAGVMGTRQHSDGVGRSVYVEARRLSHCSTLLAELVAIGPKPDERWSVLLRRTGLACCNVMKFYPCGRWLERLLPAHRPTADTLRLGSA